jgi:hypothetical protein
MQAVKSLFKEKTQNTTLVTDGLGNEILKGMAYAGGAFMVGILGVWAVTAFVVGMFAAGGPLSFVASWFEAVTGGM